MQEWFQGTPSVAFVPLVKEEELSQWEWEEQEELEALQVHVPLEVEGDWEEQQEENHQQACWVEVGMDWEVGEQSHC